MEPPMLKNVLVVDDDPGFLAALTPLIEEHLRFWGTLPLRNYAFLNIVTAAGPGSGVEGHQGDGGEHQHEQRFCGRTQSQ